VLLCILAKHSLFYSFITEIVIFTEWSKMAKAQTSKIVQHQWEMVNTAVKNKSCRLESSHYTLAGVCVTEMP